MRPIKFKAIRKDNGELVEGNLIIRSDGTCAIVICENIECGLQVWHEVLPETVCQYTGRQDIFESDFVTLEDGADGMPQEMKAGRYVVKYSELECAFFLEQLDGQHAIMFDESSICTVTGNIHNSKTPTP